MTTLRIRRWLVTSCVQAAWLAWIYINAGSANRSFPSVQYHDTVEVKENLIIESSEYIIYHACHYYLQLGILTFSIVAHLDW